MRSLLCAIFLMAAMPIQAALVDNGSYTTETETGLDWLDLSLTAGFLPEVAASSNIGWRFATQAEVATLFDVAFDGWYANGATSLGSANTSDSEYGPVYEDQLTDVIAFQNLFGNTDRTYNIYSYGFMLSDSDSGWGLGAAYRNPIGDRTFISIVDSVVSAAVTQQNDAYSYFMVRSAVVPIPAALLLFGSALVGLGWIRRK